MVHLYRAAFVGDSVGVRLLDLWSARGQPAASMTTIPRTLRCSLASR